ARGGRSLALSPTLERLRPREGPRVLRLADAMDGRRLAMPRAGGLTGIGWWCRVHDAVARPSTTNIVPSRMGAHIVTAKGSGGKGHRPFSPSFCHDPRLLAAGRVERLNACGGQVRPPAAVAQAGEAGTHPPPGEDVNKMQLRYNFRLYPTPGQRAALAKAFGCARVVYNDGLRARQE